MSDEERDAVRKLIQKLGADDPASPSIHIMKLLLDDGDTERAKSERLSVALGLAIDEIESQFGGAQDQNEEEAVLLRTLRTALSEPTQEDRKP